MADHDALTGDLGNGWSLTAAGIRRRQNGAVESDLILSNGRPVVAERCILNNTLARQDWALRATGEGRPNADDIQAILMEMLPEIIAQLQDQPRESQADGLVQIVTEMMGDLVADTLQAVDLWHDPQAEPWATMTLDGHREHWPLGSKRFRRWLARRYFEKAEKAPNAQALTDAINVLSGKALFEGDEHCVYTRLAEHDGCIYLDLADEQWRAVEVDADGWRVVDVVPVRFRRAPGMQPLPVPERGGDVSVLFDHLNVRDEDRPLILAWLAQALRPRGPYPTLPLYGEQGSAKTTMSRVLRSLIDPNISPARTEPRDERDLMIAASNGWVIITDNISRLPAWLSDSYCRLSTGGGLSTRQLYSDADEMIFDATRPIILTGIEEFVIRGDLLDRSVILTLPRIPEDKRKPERQFWEEFNTNRPQIIGALLDRIVRALREVGSVQLDRLPRMADFAIWSYAAAPDDERGTFLNAYRRNRETANEAVLDSSLVASEIVEFMDGRETWTGTAAQLLDRLTSQAGEERVARLRVWPKTPRAMRGQLDRLAPNLRRAGIEIDFDVPRESGTGARLFEVCKRPSQPSHRHRQAEDPDDSGETERDGLDAIGDGQSSQAGQPSPTPSQGESSDTSGKSGHRDGCDGCDDLMQALSESVVYPSIRNCSCGSRQYRRVENGPDTCAECGKPAP